MKKFIDNSEEFSYEHFKDQLLYKHALCPNNTRHFK